MKTAWAISTELGIQQSLGTHWPRSQKVKGQGHTVTETVTVARLLVTHVATAVCCCCRRGSACRYDYLRFLVQWLTSMNEWPPITHAGVGRAFSRVCLFVRALKWQWLELSTPNLVHVYSIAVARHALTHRSRSYCYKNRQKRHICLLFACPHSKNKRKTARYWNVLLILKNGSA